jgi:hypothetical protein
LFDQKSALAVETAAEQGGGVLGRRVPNKLFPQKMPSLKWPRKKKKKAKQYIFWAHIQNPSQSNVLTVFHSLHPADIKKLYDAKNVK